MRTPILSYCQKLKLTIWTLLNLMVLSPFAAAGDMENIPSHYVPFYCKPGRPWTIFSAYYYHDTKVMIPKFCTEHDEGDNHRGRCTAAISIAMHRDSHLDFNLLWEQIDKISQEYGDSPITERENFSNITGRYEGSAQSSQSTLFRSFSKRPYFCADYRDSCDGVQLCHRYEPLLMRSEFRNFTTRFLTRFQKLLDLLQERYHFTLSTQDRQWILKQKNGDTVTFEGPKLFIDSLPVTVSMSKSRYKPMTFHYANPFNGSVIYVDGSKVPTEFASLNEKPVFCLAYSDGGGKNLPTCGEYDELLLVNEYAQDLENLKSYIGSLMYILSELPQITSGEGTQK